MLFFPDCSTVIRGAPRLVAGAPRSVAGTPRFVAGAPRIITGAPRLVAGPSRCSQLHPKFSLALRGVSKPITITPMVLLYQSSEIPVTLKASRNTLQESATRLKLAHPNLDSTFSQTLQEASREYNTFCWCIVHPSFSLKSQIYLLRHIIQYP